MAAKDDVSASSLESKITEDHHISMERSHSHITFLTAEESALVSKEHSQMEIEILCRRVKTATAFLTYLKSKATTVAHLSLATDQLHGHGCVPHSGLFEESADPPLPMMEISTRKQGSSVDEHDGTYVTEMLKHVETVTGVMESLARRAIIAESQAAIEKGKVLLSQEEIQRKVGQIQNMSTKLEDMEKFALGTTSILCEMRQRVDDLVQETSRQKQRATENEQELCRVRTDFESLKSYVTSLISVRETLVSSEKQFQTIERLFER